MDNPNTSVIMIIIGQRQHAEELAAVESLKAKKEKKKKGKKKRNREAIGIWIET